MYIHLRICMYIYIYIYTPSLKSRHIADFMQPGTTSRTFVASQLRAPSSRFGRKKGFPIENPVILVAGWWGGWGVAAWAAWDEHQISGWISAWLWMWFFIDFTSKLAPKIEAKSMPRPIRKQPEILIDLFVFFSSFRCSWNRENLSKTMEGRSNSHFREYSLWAACEAFGAQFLNYFWVIFK